MKLDNKGFAVSGVLYSILILFLVLLLGVLSVLATGKFQFDKFKDDVITDLTTGTKAFIYVNCDNYSVKTGYDFDLMTGVQFIDENGNVGSETITNISDPTFDYNEAGTYEVTYQTTYNGVVLTATRTIVVSDIEDNYVCIS